jgi:hypothetical protein
LFLAAKVGMGKKMRAGQIRGAASEAHNRWYKMKHAGVRILGLQAADRVLEQECDTSVIFTGLYTSTVYSGREASESLPE